MTGVAEKAVRFRALHKRQRAFVFPNPWDVGSARFLESLGFEARVAAAESTKMPGPYRK